MATSEFVLNAEIRQDVGKGASRRLRRADKVPAILYGSSKKPTKLTIEHAELLHALSNQAFYSHVLTVNVGKRAEKAVLKDVQRHPSRARILHLDLQRVSETEQIQMQVPLHFIGEDVAPGVKLAGGSVSHVMNEVEVRCLPRDLPEFIEVDVSALEVNESISLSELTIPDGVQLVDFIQGTEQDQRVVSIEIRVAEVEEEEEVTEAVEPEVGGEEAEGEDSA